jgi:hypothetical protein
MDQQFSTDSISTWFILYSCSWLGKCVCVFRKKSYPFGVLNILSLSNRMVTICYCADFWSLFSGWEEQMWAEALAAQSGRFEGCVNDGVRLFLEIPEVYLVYPLWIHQDSKGVLLCLWCHTHGDVYPAWRRELPGLGDVFAVADLVWLELSSSCAL